MSAFDQDQPREAHYTITFLRRAVAPPRPGFWGRLFSKRKRSSTPSIALQTLHLDASIDECCDRYRDM